MSVLEGELIQPASYEIEVPFGKGPFSPEEKEQVCRWIRAGASRNSLMRRTGRGAATISRLAAAAGLTFKGNDVYDPADEVKHLNARAKRLDLRDKLLEDAHRLRVQLWKPTTLVQLNNRTGEFARTRLHEPTFADKRNIMTAIGIAVDKVADLERLDAPQEGKQAIIALVDLIRLQVPKQALESERLPEASE